MHYINRLQHMSKHLKNIVMNGLKSVGATFVQLPPDATPHTRGVRYFRFHTGIKCLWGAMDEEKIGRARRKRIVVRPSRFRDGLFELYTYHFPKHWSAACVANRELIKEAQRRAHALEHDHSIAALEWRVRFFDHYFRVFRRHEQPEPGLKAYARFYQYTYVVIYRELKAAQQQAQQPTAAEWISCSGSKPVEDLSFEPIVPETTFRPRRHREKNILDWAFAQHEKLYFPPPDIKNCK